MQASAREHANRDPRIKIHVPLNEMIWEPSITVMPQGGELQVDIDNSDDAHHMAFMPPEAGGYADL